MLVKVLGRLDRIIFIIRQPSAVTAKNSAARR
jgi:hypothetical protein